MATTTPAPAEHEHGHPNIVLATLALASVMSVMDLFIVNVARYWARTGDLLLVRRRPLLRFAVGARFADCFGVSFLTG